MTPVQTPDVARRRRAPRAARRSRRRAPGTSWWWGAGHNGLTAAAYLARRGRSVLVVERRTRLGGACTLEQPFADPGWVVSPCAYLVGLLHPLVIEELGPAPTRLPGASRRPPPVVPVRGRHVDRPLGRPGPQCRRGGGAVTARRRRLRRLFGALRPDAARHCGPRGATPGSATPPTPPSSQSSSPTTPRHRRCCSRLPSPTSSRPTCATSACAPRCTARGSSGPTPGRATREPPGSTSCTPRGPSRDGPARGDTSRAGWGRFPWRWPRRRVEAGAVLVTGVAVASRSPGEGVRLSGGETRPGPGRGLQRRSEAHRGAVRARRPRPLPPPRGAVAQREPGAEDQFRA